MKLILKSAMAASLLLGAAIHPALAADSKSGSTVVAGIAIANLDAVIANSNAYRTAQQQRPVTYKAQYDAAENRRSQLQAQIKPLVDKFNKDREAPNPNTASLQQQAQAIQQIQQSGQQELQRLLQPVALSEAYVQEQLEEKVDQAVKNAMAKNKVSLLLGPQAILAVNDNAYNLNQAILTELNTLLPSAQLVPPQGWEPREVREARAAQEGQAPASGQKPQGR